jgi:diaminopimelate epimerase
MAVSERKRGMQDMKPMETFYENLEANMHLFEGCGNMLGIVHLDMAGYPGINGSWKRDAKLRATLARWGKCVNSDSVMVLFGDPAKYKEQEHEGQKYHVSMSVFEPRGDDHSGLEGGISTMCGNGVRAVAAYVLESQPSLKDVQILTMSGVRRISIEQGADGENLYTVGMGEFVTSAKDLSPYVRGDRVEANASGEYIDSPIPASVLEKLPEELQDVATWSIGINGDHDHGKIDGEPHVVIEVPSDRVTNISELRAIAVKVGPIITKDLDLFPEEINVNLITRVGLDGEGRYVIWNCTHERNLGDSPDHSVTQACGTGCTVAGGVVFNRYLDNDTSKVVLVKNTGGDLEITINSAADSLRMLKKGPAHRI